VGQNKLAAEPNLVLARLCGRYDDFPGRRRGAVRSGEKKHDDGAETHQQTRGSSRHAIPLDELFLLQNFKNSHHAVVFMVQDVAVEHPLPWVVVVAHDDARARVLRDVQHVLPGDVWLPYSIAVDIESFEVEGNLRRIHAVIFVDRPGHKAIVIGEKGATLKRIGTEARHAMEALFGSKVYLETHVRVKSGWADNDRALRQLGYR